MPDPRASGAQADGVDDGLVRVMASAECPMGTPQEPALQVVSVTGTEVILVRLADGDVAAFASRCPHQGTDLSGASFFDGQLRCPYHLYLYDPRTGQNIVPCRDARPESLWKLKPGYLPTHRVEERDGWIWVAPRPQPPPPGWDPERERRPAGGRHSDPAEAAGTNPQAGNRERGHGESGDGLVEHPTKTLRVKPGTSFELRLPVTPLPGHMWRVEVEEGPLTILEERFEPADPPRHRVRVNASEPGVGVLRCAFARPWDAAVAEIRTYVVRIDDPVT